MKFIDKIIDFLNKLKNHKTQKALPEATSDAERDAFLSKTRVSSVEPPRDKTLEECISEFIRQYSLHEAYNTPDDIIAYDSFVRMFCPPEEAGENKQNQMALRDHIREHGFHASYQLASNGVAFIQLLDADDYFDDDKDFNTEKLYINCPRKDVAKLTSTIFDTVEPMQKQGLISKFQLKCVSEQYEELKPLYDDTIKRPAELYQRNDKIVVYTENHEEGQKIADKIGSLQSQYPEIFSEIRAVPLLPKANNFVSIAPNVNNQSITTSLGKSTVKTYSDLLSQVMLHSVVSGFDTFHGHGEYTRNTPLRERMRQYADEYVNGFLPKDILDQMIQNCKESFIDICRKNKVNTLYTPQQEQNQEIHHTER